MKILDEHQTIKYLINHRASISRYGDGELKLCIGRSAKSQSWNQLIEDRLKEILKSELPNHLVGIPRVFSRTDWPTAEKGKFWSRYSGSRFTSLYDQGMLYGSAFITRPDTNLSLMDESYFDLVKQLWEDRPVLLYQGKGVGFDKTGTMFTGATRRAVIYGPMVDAFSEYDNIFKMLLNLSTEETVIVLALGPTATVLAYDLCKWGRQALDLGHLGQYYAHIHPKSK